MQTQKEPSLQNNFDPIWLDDFKDLERLSPTAFVIRQILRLSRDIKTNIADVSDQQIENLTGITRKTIRAARRELISAGFIVPAGYHKYFIPTGWVKTTQPSQNNMGRKYPTSWVKTTHQTGRNYPTDGSKLPNPYNQTTDTDKTDRVFVSQKAEIQTDEIPYLRQTYPFRDREKLKGHLIARGYTEHEASQFLESFYQEYTGRKEAVRV